MFDYGKDKPVFDRSKFPPEMRAEIELEDAMTDAEELLEIDETLKDKTQSEREMYFRGRADYLTSLMKRIEENRQLVKRLQKRNRRLHNI